MMIQEFVKEVNRTARNAVGEIHTALPGEVTAFDPATSRASVQPKAKFRKPNGETMDFPLVTGVPVMFPQSANVTVAWPIKPGDGCLLIFCEQALDYWLYQKETDTALDFDLSSAIAVPNVCTAGKDAMQTACEEDAVVLQSDSVVLKVKKDGVHILGDLEVSGNITSTSGTMNITGGFTRIVGTLQVDGPIVATGDIQAENRVSLASHMHGGDSGGTTTPPL